MLSTKLTGGAYVGHCIICEETRQQGIYICSSFICTSCEYNIIHTDTKEAKYHYYVQKLKPINQLTLYS